MTRKGRKGCSKGIAQSAKIVDLRFLAQKLAFAAAKNPKRIDRGAVNDSAGKYLYNVCHNVFEDLGRDSAMRVAPCREVKEVQTLLQEGWFQARKKEWTGHDRPV